MTEARVRELMKDKNFISNNSGLTVFYYAQGHVTVVRRDEKVFRVMVHHPLQGWLERRINFLNPVAAATYALRHCVTKREVKP
jgi:hypothetical protein